jgi:hypothetical protein
MELIPFSVTFLSTSHYDVQCNSSEIGQLFEILYISDHWRLENLRLIYCVLKVYFYASEGGYRKQSCACSACCNKTVRET